jgi:hypothetical protein
MSRERGITCIAFGLGGDAASAFGRLAPTCAMRGTRFEPVSDVLAALAVSPLARSETLRVSLRATDRVQI